MKFFTSSMFWPATPNVQVQGEKVLCCFKSVGSVRNAGTLTFLKMWSYKSAFSSENFIMVGLFATFIKGIKLTACIWQQYSFPPSGGCIIGDCIICKYHVRSVYYNHSLYIYYPFIISVWIRMASWNKYFIVTDFP